MNLSFILAVVLVDLASCGFYAPPYSPDLLAPAPVKVKEVVPDEIGVTIKWEAPEKDMRGKELRALTGYRIYRMEADPPKDGEGGVFGAYREGNGNKFEEELLAFIQDTYLTALKELRSKARAEGRTERTVTVPKQFKTFSYTDTAVSRGKIYLYRIVPVGEVNNEGASNLLIKVRFNGRESSLSAEPSAKGSLKRSEIKW